MKLNTFLRDSSLLEQKRMKRLMAKILGVVYKYLYHSFSFSYDFIANLVSAGNWFKWVKEIAQFAKIDDRILEIGFGSGVLMTHLVTHGFHVVGIDESQQMVKITRKRLSKYVKSGIICRADIKTIPFQSETFDLILSTFPSEYIFQSGFLDEINRLLQKNGRFLSLIGVEFNRRTIMDLFYRLLFQITYKKSPREDKIQNSTETILKKVKYLRVNKDGRILIFVSYVK